MTQNLFHDKDHAPTGALLKRTLGPRIAYWDDVRKSIDGTREEWKYYGATIGWQMKLFLGSRNLLFMTPCKGYFILSFVFGDKGVERVRQSSLPPALISELLQARRYAEGRGIRITVRSRRSAEEAKQLLALKSIV